MKRTWYTHKKEKGIVNICFEVQCVNFIHFIWILRVNRAVSRLRGFQTNHHLSALLDFSLRMFSRKVFHFTTTPVWCCTKKFSKICHLFVFFKQYWLIWNKLLIGNLTCVIFFPLCLNLLCFYTFVVYIDISLLSLVLRSLYTPYKHIIFHPCYD